MIFLSSVFILVAIFFSLKLAERQSRYWLLSPASAMSAYFLLVMLPGLYVHNNALATERAFLAHAIWFFGVLLSMLLSVTVSGVRSGQGRSVETLQALYGNKRVIVFFVLLSIPAVLITFFMLGRVPLFIGLGSLFGENSDLTMHAARRMNTLQHRSGDTVYFGQGYLRQIYAVVSPVFLVALYILWKRGSLRKMASLLVVPMMGFLVLAAALNGQIWLAVNVLVLFLMAHYYQLISSGRGGVEYSLIFRGAVAYLLLIGFALGYRYLQSLQGRDLEDFFLNFLRRVYSPGAVDLFVIFPDIQAFRYGATWANDLRGILPGSIQSFAYEVHYLVHGGGWGFTFSPGIVAGSYVNFGYVGVFFVGFIFTFVFSSIFNWLMKSGSVVKVAMALYISQRFMLAMPADIVTYAVALITVLLMYLAYIFLNSVYWAVALRKRVAA